MLSNEADTSDKHTKCMALFNERGYENAKSFASLLLAYSLWLIVLFSHLQAISCKPELPDIGCESYIHTG